mgnify:CR=1 FL=1
MKSLQDLDIFVRTVDGGSLSATARALDLTPAAASAALKRLEAELGVALCRPEEGRVANESVPAWRSGC